MRWRSLYHDVGMERHQSFLGVAAGKEGELVELDEGHFGSLAYVLSVGVVLSETSLLSNT